MNENGDRASSNPMAEVPSVDRWLNLAALLPWPLPLPRTSDGRQCQIADLNSIYSEECSRLELLVDSYGRDAEIAIPTPVIEEYAKFRPTPLRRAYGLEKAIGYRGKILFKREDGNPSGSHKPNTAIPQAWYAKAQGLDGLITDTGAGQWGCALAWAARACKIHCTVFMTRGSFKTKPYRRYLMQLMGADVYGSPSELTASGRRLLAEDPDHQGSLGIGMGEAMEMMRNQPGTRLALGCMSYYAALHQTVIGLELARQLEAEGIEPDVLIGCVGGGTNFTGFIAPFVAGQPYWSGQRPRFLAVESDRIPVLTSGEYRYEYADAFGLTPMVKMYTLGREFLPQRMHAGGLRYHGKSPILSLLYHRKQVESAAVSTNDAFDAGKLFYEAEGILVAPETSHAISQVISEARAFQQRGEQKTIVFCLSGTGYLDLAGYADQFNLI